jgi:hypothetical protein
LKGKSLDTEDMHIKSTSKQLAHTLASFHALNMPFTKKPTWLYETILNYLDKIETDINFQTKTDREKFQKFKSLKLIKEFTELK